MATQVVEEDLFIVALLLLVVDVHVPAWEQSAGRRREDTLGDSERTEAADFQDGSP